MTRARARQQGRAKLRGLFDVRALTPHPSSWLLVFHIVCPACEGMRTFPVQILYADPYAALAACRGLLPRERLSMLSSGREVSFLLLM